MNELVWCENPAHSRKPHEATATGRYSNADSAATDPAECHYPHNAGYYAGEPAPPPNYWVPALGHPLTVHD